MRTGDGRREHECDDETESDTHCCQIEAPDIGSHAISMNLPSYISDYVFRGTERLLTAVTKGDKRSAGSRFIANKYVKYIRRMP
jgi:hypothetical protein